MTPEQTKILSARLKEMREKKGLTALQVAQKMGPGYQPPRIYNIESGYKPVGFGMIESYAAACGFTVRIEFDEI
jgi:transcriptional regulator with XRE-family HTH domain